MSDPMTNKMKILLWGIILVILIGFLSWLQINITDNEQIPEKSLFTVLLEMICFALLSLVITKLLHFRFSLTKIHYRMSFLIASIIGLLLACAASFYHADFSNLWLLPIFIASSFMGAFIASGLYEGWWEDNAPPSPEIRTAVVQAHQAYMDNKSKKNWQKRLFDIILSSFSLIISIPIWLFIVFLIWWEDPGPVLFVKNAVGRKGVNFKQLKFRSMILNAEKETGPISGYENDERVLFFGRFLRKTALDELPQLINILRGDMSYVGPRPQRTVLVHGYLQRLPHYAARHRVRPGLAGLAQVADTYDISPQEKLAWDLVYIEHANLWFDIKLAMAAFLLVFVLRWRSQEEPEKVIRKMLNVYKPALQTNIKPD